MLNGAEGLPGYRSRLALVVVTLPPWHTPPLPEDWAELPVRRGRVQSVPRRGKRAAFGTSVRSIRGGRWLRGDWPSPPPPDRRGAELRGGRATSPGGLPSPCGIFGGGQGGLHHHRTAPTQADGWRPPPGPRVECARTYVLSLQRCLTWAILRILPKPLVGALLRPPPWVYGPGGARAVGARYRCGAWAYSRLRMYVYRGYNRHVR